MGRFKHGSSCAVKVGRPPVRLCQVSVLRHAKHTDSTVAVHPLSTSPGMMQCNCPHREDNVWLLLHALCACCARCNTGDLTCLNVRR